jgi:methionyl aminopeptidase
MSIESHIDYLGICRISKIVAETLRKMKEFTRPGMTTGELDDYGYSLLKQCKANAAPKLVYGFPGWTCISVNHEVAHGVPSKNMYLKDGDLINIDVSAEIGGYFGDNGTSFIVGKDIHNLKPLIDFSKKMLRKAISNVRDGIKINEMGREVESEVKQSGYSVIKNLVGHGIGRRLHEDPHEIPCYYDSSNNGVFKKNMVVAIETFISTKTSYTYPKGNGWTFVTKDRSFVAQHEHTILVTDDEPAILTGDNDIF